MLKLNILTQNGISLHDSALFELLSVKIRGVDLWTKSTVTNFRKICSRI